ncbi:MAG: hypothetical protein ACXVII_30690 [Solirubrobacteraceae bacterium]
MRRLGVFVLPVLAALIVVGSAAASSPRPSLTLHGTAPVIVDGAHFRSGERVKITSLPGPSVSVRANSRGAFSLTLRGVPVDRCSGLIVHARGTAGSLAVARRPPLRQCPPARAQGSVS